MRYTVKNDEEGLTVKRVLKDRIGISSRLYTRLKKHQRFTVDGIYRLPHEPVHSGEVIEVMFDYEKNTFACEPRELEVLFEDEVLLVVNKDPFYVVHPTLGHPGGTLMNFAAAHLAGQQDQSKIRFVNRLDRDTSGIVIMAKNQFIHHQLSEAMRRDEVEKRYWALVEGRIEAETQLIDAPIARESEDSIRRVVRADGKACRSRVTVLERYGDKTLVAVELLTGRTHQIRVHMAHIGHPVVGDVLYNGPSELVDRQCLHCHEMTLTHPLTRERLEIVAPLKDDMRSAIEQLRR